MKLLKRITTTILLIAVLTTTVGCYVISAQKMRNVKGTYKLTQYTYIPQYERKEGYTPRTFDYINDEEYKYEDYLIVTGESTGYYVHKATGVEAYVKEVALRYEYSQEDTSKVSYVIYNDALNAGDETGQNKLGVTKNSLNYSKNAFDYTQLFTDKKMRSEDISVRWEKVDRATDLSYVNEQLGAIKSYDYASFGARGIYSLDTPINIETAELVDTGYLYFFYVFETASGQTKATAYYATIDKPTEQITQEMPLSLISDNWKSISLNGDTWTPTYEYSADYYSLEKDGVRYTISRISTDNSAKRLSELIADRIPTE